MRDRSSAPGEIQRRDTKKLARIAQPGHRITGDPRDSVAGAGWEVAFVAIDDRSWGALRKSIATRPRLRRWRFSKRLWSYPALGMRIKRLLTDNGSAFRSRLFARTCHALGIKHSFTRPYSPQTNGSAEPFIQTCLRE